MSVKSRKEDTISFLYIGNHAGYFLTHRMPVFAALLKTGFSVSVAVPTTRDNLEKHVTDNGFEDIKKNGFKVFPLHLARNSRNILHEVLSFISIFRIIREVNPQVTFHSTIKPVLYGGIYLFFFPVRRSVFLINGLGYLFSDERLLSRIVQKIALLFYRVVFSGSNIRVIFQNHEDRDLFVQKRIVSFDKTSVILGSGIDLRKYPCTIEAPGKLIVVFIGRLLWNKGVGEFVEAAKKLKKEHVIFELVGDTDEENPMGIPKSQLEHWRDEGIIEWKGWSKNIQEVLVRSHVVCLPTYYREGIPKSLIEAAACSRPIITTDTPGCREVVSNNVNGLLVEPKSVPSLVTAITKLLGSRELRLQMGSEGRKIAEKKFAVEIIAEQTLRICTGLIE